MITVAVAQLRSVSKREQHGHFTAWLLDCNLLQCDHSMVYFLHLTKELKKGFFLYKSIKKMHCKVQKLHISASPLGNVFMSWVYSTWKPFLGL